MLPVHLQSEGYVSYTMHEHCAGGCALPWLNISLDSTAHGALSLLRVELLEVSLVLLLATTCTGALTGMAAMGWRALICLPGYGRLLIGCFFPFFGVEVKAGAILSLLAGGWCCPL